jgi:hypothetical protein
MAVRDGVTAGIRNCPNGAHEEVAMGEGTAVKGEVVA